MTENIVAHIKELLYVKRWTREQIVEVSTSIPNSIWESLLCVNEKSLGLLMCYDETFEKYQLSALLEEMKFHSVKVGFLYTHRDNSIHLISILSSNADIRLLEEFMTPGELLAFINRNGVPNTPYYILLPKLLNGTLKFFLALIDGLFSLFDKNDKSLVYYNPFNSNSLLEDKPLYDYLQEHYPESQRNQIDLVDGKSIPFAIIVPNEVRNMVVMYPKDETHLQVGQDNGVLYPFPFNSEKVCALSISDVRESSSVIEHFTHLIESLQTENKNDTSHSEGVVESLDMSGLEILQTEPSMSFSEESYSDVEIEIPDKSGKKIIKKIPKYEKIILNDINMARQTSYQTQIELASDLKRYLHGFQERLAEVAKNYQAKSHDLYEAGMMDETHKDFEENYVRETVAHIAGVVELINESDIPFVQKYIEKMEELREQYGN